MESRRTEIIDAIKNNSVIQIVYNYDHRPQDQKAKKRYAKVIRPFVIGTSKANNPMIRAYEYDEWRLQTDTLQDDDPDVKFRYTGEDRLKGKSFKTYTTTSSPKWKTYLLKQITFWDVLGTDDIDIPKEFTPSYKQGDKLFNNIIYQKQK